MHRCPGWGVDDCPSAAKVSDEHEDVDRCPSCERLNRAWEVSVKLKGKRLRTEASADNAKAVYDAMLKGVI